MERGKDGGGLAVGERVGGGAKVLFREL